MSVEKIRIIEKVLKQKPRAYKKLEKLISLANNLDVDSDRENKRKLEYEVLKSAVDTAFQVAIVIVLRFYLFHITHSP